jgi:hypothetical protein
MKTTYQVGKKIVWIAILLVLASLACNIDAATPEPTMAIPTAQLAEPVPTAQPIEPTPTQKPTSVPPTPTVTALPPPKIIASGFTFLRAEDSFDFVTGEIGNLTGGDLYIYRASATDYRTLANNSPQIGGQLLFDAEKAVTMDVEIFDASHFVTNIETQKKIASASMQTSFTDLEIPLELYAVYLYKRNQTPGDYVLFTVADIEPDGVALDYAVFEISE